MQTGLAIAHDRAPYSKHHGALQRSCGLQVVCNSIAWYSSSMGRHRSAHLHNPDAARRAVHLPGRKIFSSCLNGLVLLRGWQHFVLLATVDHKHTFASVPCGLIAGQGRESHLFPLLGEATSVMPGRASLMLLATVLIAPGLRDKGRK